MFHRLTQIILYCDFKLVVQAIKTLFKQRVVLNERVWYVNCLFFISLISFEKSTNYNFVCSL